MTTTFSVERLREAMNWVIPADSSPGAGTDAGVERLLALIASLGPEVESAYAHNLDTLSEADLKASTNAFATMFIEHVRDVYYATPDTGSWSDIRFEVTD